MMGHFAPCVEHIVETEEGEELSEWRTEMHGDSMFEKRWQAS